MLSARSAGVVQSSAPNDVIQSLLVAARSADLIDGVVMLDMDPWTLTPIARVALTVSEITDGVGMQYLWAPVLSALNKAIFELDLTKLAVVGPPCVAEAARLLVNVENERLKPYQQVLRLIISQFCTGVYMPNMIPELLEGGMGISRHLVRNITTSTENGTMEVVLWDGATHTILLTEVERFTRHGCSTCTDFLGEQADIVVGSVGAEEGFATLIVRTTAGNTFVQNALRFGLLEATDKVNKKALEVAKAEKDRRARAQAFDKLRILMLDALSDPKKRAVVRKQFVKLYGSPEGRVKNREKSDVSCSGC
jgi:coenzyme F420 hydrogenase subunit beta